VLKHARIETSTVIFNGDPRSCPIFHCQSHMYELCTGMLAGVKNQFPYRIEEEEFDILILWLRSAVGD
jgi:hypothetical protein